MKWSTLVRMQWSTLIPWFLTVGSAAVLYMIAYFLVDNIQWFRALALSDPAADNLEFRMHVHHLHFAMIKRAIGLFSGFSLVFLGLGAAFYHSRARSSISAQVPNSVAVEVVSASPGVLAMVLGVVLLVTTIVSKDRFPVYLESPPTSMQGGGFNIPDMPAGFVEETP